MGGRFCVLPKEFVYYFSKRKKKKNPSFEYIPIQYISIMGDYMVDGYEMDVYEWPSMSLRYPLIYSLTVS